MTVLLLGFEPFGGERINISWEAVRRVRRRGVVARRLPVSWSRVSAAVRRALREVRPSVVIAFGQGTRGAVRVERIAINRCGARIPDNDGERREETPIARGPLALEATLPADAILAALKDAGIRARRSFHAGTYLCNQALYQLLRSGVRAGFIHLPPHPTSRRTRGCMTVAQAVRVVETVLDRIRSGGPGAPGSGGRELRSRRARRG